MRSEVGEALCFPTACTSHAEALGCSSKDVSMPWTGRGLGSASEAAMAHKSTPGTLAK